MTFEQLGQAESIGAAGLDVDDLAGDLRGIQSQTVDGDDLRTAGLDHVADLQAAGVDAEHLGAAGLHADGRRLAGLDAEYFGGDELDADHLGGFWTRY